MTFTVFNESRETPRSEMKKSFLRLVPAPGTFLGGALALGGSFNHRDEVGAVFIAMALAEGNREGIFNSEGLWGGIPGAHPITQALIAGPGCPSQTWAVLGDISGRNTSKLILKGVQRGLCTPSTVPPRSFSSGTACSYYNKHLSRNLALICILAALILMKYANVCKMKFIS